MKCRVLTGHSNDWRRPDNQKIGGKNLPTGTISALLFQFFPKFPRSLPPFWIGFQLTKWKRPSVKLSPHFSTTYSPFPNFTPRRREDIKLYLLLSWALLFISGFILFISFISAPLNCAQLFYNVVYNYVNLFLMIY